MKRKQLLFWSVLMFCLLFWQTATSFEIDDSYYTEGVVNRADDGSLVVSDEVFRVDESLQVRDDNGGFLAYSTLRKGNVVLVYVHDGSGAEGQPLLVKQLTVIRRPGRLSGPPQ